MGLFENYRLKAAGLKAGTAGDALVLHDEVRILWSTRNRIGWAFFGAQRTPCTFVRINGVG